MDLMITKHCPLADAVSPIPVDWQVRDVFAGSSAAAQV